MKARRSLPHRLFRRLVPLVAACAAAPSFAQDPVHVVQPGDTLWGIAGHYLQSPLRWPDVQQRNGVGDPKLLQPGTPLRIDAAGLHRVDLARVGTNANPGADASSRARPESGEQPIAPAHAAWTLDPLAVAAVAELAGSARLKRGDTAPRPLDAGTSIRAGDILETDDRTYLSFQLRDGSTLVMPSHSTVRVNVADGATTRLQLLDGRIEARVAKQHGRTFEIRSRLVTVGVRGTHFRVRDEHGLVTAEVLSGAVALSVAGHPELTLDAGHGTAIADADALAPAPLLPPPALNDGDAATRVLSVAPMPQTHGYRLLLATDPTFIHVAYEATSADGTFALPDTLPGGFYHARASAFDTHDIEGLPGERIVHVPDAAHADGARRTHDGRYEIRWAAPAGQRCIFELSRSPDFSQPIVSAPAVYGDGTVVGPLDVPGHYYWRARAVTADDDRTLATGAFDVPAAAPTRD